MASIEKEQSVAVTYPQRDMQIAIQGPHNTITQIACAGKAPALNSGDSIIKVLEGITEKVVEVQRGQATLLQKLETIQEGQDARLQELAILRQQQVRLIQSVGRLEDGMTRLENRMSRPERRLDAIHQGVRGYPI